MRKFMMYSGLKAIDPTKLETIVFLKKGKAYIKSDGALEIFKDNKFYAMAR